MQLRHAALTDTGRSRDHNEDTYGIEAATERPEGALFLVCDGAGGLAAGETASDLAVKRIIKDYYAFPGRDRGAALTAAFQAANRDVFAAGQGQMGTTGVAAVFLNDAVLVANVGDSRALLVRDGKPHQISRDHSFVAEQVAAGVITAEQAKTSTYRNIITRALGNRPEVDVDVFRLPVTTGDRIVLCSDGLHGQVEPEEIAQAVTLVALDKAVERLIALANDRGGPDNITVIAVEVLALSFQPTEATPVRTERLTTEAEMVSGPAPQPAQPALEATPPTVKMAQPPVVVPPPLAREPQQNASGRSLLGWLVVAVALLAVIAYFGWSFLNIGPAAPAATPTVPALTPPGAPTPTLVPTQPPATTVTATGTLTGTTVITP